MNGITETIASFVTTRWMSRKHLARQDFEQLQAKALGRWLSRDLPRAAFYNRAPNHLSELPVIDKSVVMANFKDFNIHGIAANEAWEAMSRGCGIDGLTVGASTGTSGNRGLFIISEAEKYRWLGSILAKTIADLLWTRQRVAIILPQHTSLYDGAGKTGRIDLRFFDLGLGPEAWRADLETFDPTVIVAPPKILQHFAQSGFRLGPLRVFSAGETLDPVDRAGIEAYLGFRLDQIYMATEGLLGVTCRHGSLHLAEDSLCFEFEPAANGLVNPLVTAFRRQTQIMARYRMNDLLRLSERPCRCGSPLRTVEEIVGRMDDVFHLNTPDGLVVFTPDILRNTVLLADRRITDFRLAQTAPDAIELSLPLALDDDAATAAVGALTLLMAKRDVLATITLVRTRFALDTSRKLRRVESRIAVRKNP